MREYRGMDALVRTEAPGTGASCKFGLTREQRMVHHRSCVQTRASLDKYLHEEAHAYQDISIVVTGRHPHHLKGRHVRSYDLFRLG